MPEIEQLEQQQTAVETASEQVEIKPDGEAVSTGEQDRDEKGRFKGAQDRINELTRQRHDAERKARYWEDVAQQSHADKQEQAPKRDDYATDDDYQSALVKFGSAEAVREALSKRDKDEASRARVDSAELARRTFRERAKALKDEMPDFEEVMASTEVMLSDELQSAILDSEAGPRLAMYLAKNTGEADRLTGLKGYALGKELARIEDKLTAAKTVATSSAPTPARTVNVGSAIQQDPNRMTQAEYEQWRMKQHPRWAR